MRRRDFIVALGGVGMVSIGSHAQPATAPIIGVLGSESPRAWKDRLDAFRIGLGEVGYAEGQSVIFEYRWADGHNDRLPELAADLVRQKVSVIVVLGSTPSAIAAKQATSAIPIVFRIGTDPVEAGLVASFNRPGGNLTGVTTLGAALAPKQPELLHEVIPTATVFGLLLNPTNPTITKMESRDVLAAGRALGLELRTLSASTEHDFEQVFASLAELKAGGLVIATDTFFNAQSQTLAALALRHGMPAVSPYKEFAMAGGLISYGGGVVDASRIAGVFVGRILKGERPGDIPIEQATHLDLVVNAKTSKSLGLILPPTVLAIADEVIE